MMMGIGIFMILAGTVNLIDVVRRKGERFEYAGAMLLQELGLMFVASQMMPRGTVALVVTLLFGVGIFSTMGLWWKLFVKFRNETKVQS